MLLRPVPFEFSIEKGLNHVKCSTGMCESNPIIYIIFESLLVFRHSLMYVSVLADCALPAYRSSVMEPCFQNRSTKRQFIDFDDDSCVETRTICTLSWYDIFDF